MRDLIFFPLATVLAGAFVFTALDPFADRPPRGPLSGGGRNAEDVTVQGRELSRFLPGNYDGVKIVTPQGAAAPVLEITRKADEVYDYPRSGPNIVLAEDLEYAFEARPIEVVIVARSAGDFPASQFEADYYARTDAESGWKRFDLTPEFKAYSFTYKVPPRQPVWGYDYIGVRPVTPDKHRVMEVQSIRIHAIGPKTRDEAPAPSTSAPIISVPSTPAAPAAAPATSAPAAPH